MSESQKVNTYTFIDLFSGAGGFSEGFLQAEHNDSIYEFLLASDINTTCEVTHRMRYNEQLGLKTAFLTKDIMSPDFIEELTKRIEDNFGHREIDVLLGGPPCQSFSLAGERKKNDKKDDLFSYYLKVIQAIKPKYFVMENVAGILTKDKGKIKERILSEIRNIIDFESLDTLVSLLNQSHVANSIKSSDQENYSLIVDVLKIALEQNRIECQRRNDYMEIINIIEEFEINKSQKDFLLEALLDKKNDIENLVLEKFLLKLSDDFVNAYRNNKKVSEDDRNVVRQALSLLNRHHALASISKHVKAEIYNNHLNRSAYKERYDKIVSATDVNSILEVLSAQVTYLKQIGNSDNVVAILDKINLSMEVLYEGAHKNIQRLKALLNKSLSDKDVLKLICAQIDKVLLYRIDDAIVLNASWYGVPQNRQRVVFIGCRNDQKLIREVPSTINTEEFVTAAEAIGDLNYIKVGEEAINYNKTFSSSFKKTQFGHINRTILGKKKPEEGADSRYTSQKTFSEWSRQGRLNPARFTVQPPAYTSANSWEEYQAHAVRKVPLANHETSNHNKEVQERYALIRKHGDYNKAREQDPNNPLLNTKKRNYSLLFENQPSTTILTIGDDFAHYGANRALTVREMARLQSFDDSFVFQGKRTTGGDRRKVEVPQFTQVGNAVPPLMAHAIALEILKNIN